MSGSDEQTAAGLTRRALLGGGALAGAALALGAMGDPNAAAEAPAPAAPAEPPAAFELEETPIAELAAGMAQGKWTSRALVERYMARIAAVNERGPALRCVLEMNPDALADADALDAERRAKGPRGPLHGIPILLKD